MLQNTRCLSSKRRWTSLAAMFHLPHGPKHGLKIPIARTDSICDTDLFHIQSRLCFTIFILNSFCNPASSFKLLNTIKSICLYHYHETSSVCGQTFFFTKIMLYHYHYSMYYSLHSFRGRWSFHCMFDFLLLCPVLWMHDQAKSQCRLVYLFVPSIPSTYSSSCSLIWPRTKPVVIERRALQKYFNAFVATRSRITSRPRKKETIMF